jgi:hypothetical protein
LGFPPSRKHPIAAEDWGTFDPFSRLPHDSTWTPVSELLEGAFRQLVIESIDYYRKVDKDELPFTYGEKQLPSLLIPAFRSFADLVFAEQPMVRGRGKSKSEGWTDYWILKGDTGFFVEVKFAWHRAGTVLGKEVWFPTGGKDEFVWKGVVKEVRKDALQVKLTDRELVTKRYRRKYGSLKGKSRWISRESLARVNEAVKLRRLIEGHVVLLKREENSWNLVIDQMKDVTKKDRRGVSEAEKLSLKEKHLFGVALLLMPVFVSTKDPKDKKRPIPPIEMQTHFKAMVERSGMGPDWARAWYLKGDIQAYDWSEPKEPNFERYPALFMFCRVDKIK